MKPLQPTIAFFTVVLTATLCCHNGVTTPEPEQPIGTIALVRTRVEAGRSGQVKDVESSRDFYDNESVRVRDNGKGRISFNDGSEITLYNNTSAEQVVAQFSPPEVKLLLTEQGFKGYVPKGSKFIVDMPNGAQVTILGTQFFIVFNESTQYTTVGNFDGTVRFRPPGGSEQGLPPATMADIAPDGRVDFYELPYDPETFDRTADSAGSPFDGLRELRNEFQQPQPGEGTPVEPTAAPVQTVTRYLVVPQGELFGPDLAERWSEDPDGYVIDFFFRKDVFLPDGSPFTSAYVKERLTAEWAYAIEGHVQLEVIDDYVIRFSLDSPSIFYALDEMSRFEFEVQLGGPG